jgi:CPA2 family monovalent cation:H+ antiporter-2
VVAVSAITTLLTPYLIRWADPFSVRLANAVPAKLSRMFNLYTEWLQSIRPEGDQAALAGMIRRILLQVLINYCLVAALFLSGAFVAKAGEAWLTRWLSDASLQKTVIWGSALTLSLPFLIAAYRKLKALSMLLAELGVRATFAGRRMERVRRVIAEIIPAASIVGMMLLLSALSASILPPAEMLVLVLVVVGLLGAVLWRSFVRLHARLQIALMETLEGG